jgi:hypothetical protein
MKQSRAASLVEAIINIMVGFGLSIGCQAIFLPLLGVEIPWAANFYFASIMTVMSIARQFVLRRVFEALHIRRPLSPFMQAVIAERFRQIEFEGWDATHDDEHPIGQIARAGAAYALWNGGFARGTVRDHIWPWSLDWWKPQNFRRDLVRAAALIVAEGEKHERNRKRVNDNKRKIIARKIQERRENGNKVPPLRGLTDEEIERLKISARGHLGEILNGNVEGRAP